MQRKQHTLWLLTVIAAPAAHFSGCGWFGALLAGAVFLTLSTIPTNWEGLAKPLAAVQILWLGVAAGMLVQNAAAYWPSDNDTVVPLTLLVLALLTDEASAPRIGAVLGFCLVLLALPLGWSAAKTLELHWLKPTLDRWPYGIAGTLLLTFLPGGEGARRWTAVGIPIACALLAQGILSPQVADAVADPFYETGRTLGHMEPILSTAMTLSYYAMLSWMKTAANHMAGKWSSALFAVPCAGVMLTDLQWSLTALLLSATMWIIVPFGRFLTVPKKKSKKNENSA